VEGEGERVAEDERNALGFSEILWDSTVDDHEIGESRCESRERIMRCLESF